MDSAYWDILPGADDADTSEDDEPDEKPFTPGLEVPCTRCKHRSRPCRQCRERQGRLEVTTADERRPSPEIACSPDRASSASGHRATVIAASASEVVLPDVILQPAEDDDSPGASQKNTLAVPGPTYTSMYTNSPSWMSTYTSSTCATTYTTAHERAYTEGGDDLLGVRNPGRPPHPRRPRTTGRRDAGLRSTGGGAWERRSTRRISGMATGTEFEGWDETEIESGSYCMVEGARWEEQRFIRTLHPQHRHQQHAGKRERRRFYYSPSKEAARSRPLPLVDPPSPRYMFDVITMTASGSRPRLWAVSHVSDKGHTRVVYSMAYARGTGFARGLWCLPVPIDEGVGGILGFIWREGVWKVFLGYLNDSLGYRGGKFDTLDEVD